MNGRRPFDAKASKRSHGQANVGDSVAPRWRPVRRGLHEQVVNRVGMDIVTGKLKAGDILVEAEVSYELGVSRNGVREAIKVLASKGLVHSRPNVGITIRPRTDWNMLDPDILWWWSESDNIAGFVEAVLGVRTIVEPEAAALAATNGSKRDLSKIRRMYQAMADNVKNTDRALEADRDFHVAIMEASGNEILRSLGALVEAALIAFFRLTEQSSPGTLAKGLRRHESILQAIEAGDADGARAEMHRMLDDTRKLLARMLVDPRHAAGRGNRARIKKRRASVSSRK